MSGSVAVAPTVAQNPRRWLILAAACTAVFITTVDTGGLIQLVLAAITKELKPDATSITMMGSIAQLVMACMLLGAGSVADIFGRKKVLLVGIVVYLAISVWAFFVRSGPELAWNRGLSGVAAALINPMVAATIMAVFDREELQKAMSIYITFLAIAATIGSPICEFLNSSFGWRSTFLFVALLALVALLFVAPVVPDTKSSTKRRLDIIGIALSGAGLLGVVYGLNSAGDVGFTAPKAYLPLLAGIALLVALVLYSKRVKFPAIQTRLFSNPLFSFGMVLVLIIYITCNIGCFWAAVYGLTIENFLTPMDVGWIYLWWGVGMTVFGFLMGRIGDKIKPHISIPVGMIVIAISCLVMGSQLRPGGSVLLLYIGAFLAGSGWSIANTPRMAISLSTVPTDWAATGASTNQCFGWLGMTFTIAFSGALFPLFANPAWAKAAANAPAITNWYAGPGIPDLVNTWAATWGQSLYATHIVFAAVALLFGIWAWFIFRKPVYVTKID